MTDKKDVKDYYIIKYAIVIGYLAASIAILTQFIKLSNFNYKSTDISAYNLSALATSINTGLQITIISIGLAVGWLSALIICEKNNINPYLYMLLVGITSGCLLLSGIFLVSSASKALKYFNTSLPTGIGIGGIIIGAVLIFVGIFHAINNRGVKEVKEASRGSTNPLLLARV